MKELKWQTIHLTQNRMRGLVYLFIFLYIPSRTPLTGSELNVIHKASVSVDPGDGNIVFDMTQMLNTFQRLLSR